jgi:hypothetical protein
LGKRKAPVREAAFDSSRIARAFELLVYSCRSETNESQSQSDLEKPFSTGCEQNSWFVFLVVLIFDMLLRIF